ncbi:MAG: hypothetical protein QOJ12_590, partial [Thermoleophilales bacterium]|nr:hypothetical protein [Thermoleophilales bacterium]
MRCDDCNRTDLLRAAAARAGNGLPAIERGMPLPAGTGLSRRNFVARSAGLALAIYGGGMVRLPGLEEGIARAAASPAQPVLVSVFLEGGMDALSVLFPAGDPLYHKLRPKLALSGGTPFAEDDRLHWHPAARSLAELHGERKVTVMPAIGYAHPDHSHFTSRHYWEVGATDAGLRTGWLGRYLDRVGVADNPLQGLSLDAKLAPALATARVPVASVDGPDQYDFWSHGVWGEVQDRMLAALGPLGAAQPNDPALRAAGNVAVQADRLRSRLLPFAEQDGKPGYTSPVAYPQSKEDFPRRLAGLAAMLAAGLPMRVVALTAPGHYDTHSDQPGALQRGLQLTSDSLLAFQRDVEARGIADRVLVHVWSEFGRRAEENGSQGTDHGAAGIGFLIGSRVRGRMIGEYPGLAKLDDEGNLRATADYRGLYGAL